MRRIAQRRVRERGVWLWIRALKVVSVPSLMVMRLFQSLLFPLVS
jgi:hypothetical protein